MITIKANNLNEAWRRAFIKLMEEGSKTDNTKYYRDEFIAFEILDASEKNVDLYFPMSEEYLKNVNRILRPER